MIFDFGRQGNPLDSAEDSHFNQIIDDHSFTRTVGCDVNHDGNSAPLEVDVSLAIVRR